MKRKNTCVTSYITHGAITTNKVLDAIVAIDPLIITIVIKVLKLTCLRMHKFIILHLPTTSYE